MKRKILLACTILACALSFSQDREMKYIAENQPVAYLGNGFYRNHVLPGGWGDPTVVKVGDDYYMPIATYPGKKAPAGK